jgi:uncharacterized protein
VRHWLFLLLLCAFGFGAPCRAAEVIPPVPAQYFNDYASVVSTSDADQFNRQLAQNERDTSNQIIVAIYPKMQTESDIADYTFRVKETWHVGQKGKNNGAVLFVFVQDHKLFIQTNYGLEGTLPDATCKNIIDQDITPRFKSGDYTGGIRAGVGSILAATKGEYKGSGSTVAERGGVPVSLVYRIGGIFFAAFVLFGLLLAFLNFFGGTFYQRHARGLSALENAYLMILRTGFYAIMSSGRSSGSGSYGGGGGSSRGGRYSGGGGSGGGGGAGGSW